MGACALWQMIVCVATRDRHARIDLLLFARQHAMARGVHEVEPVRRKIVHVGRRVEIVLAVPPRAQRRYRVLVERALELRR